MKKVCSVIYSNKKIPQGQTIFILLWIYSQIRLILDFIDLTSSRVAASKGPKQIYFCI